MVDDGSVEVDDGNTVVDDGSVEVNDGNTVVDDGSVEVDDGCKSECIACYMFSC